MGALERWPLVGRHEDVEVFRRALAGGEVGCVIHGQAGVGKTRLAEECRAAAEALGHPTATAVASRTAAQLPLGALAHLIPPALASGRAFDPVQIYRHVQDDLLSQHGDRPLVLSIDDVHLLDVASATLVGQLVTAGRVFLIGTIRDGVPVTDAVAALWRRPAVTRIDLGDLDQPDVATVLHLALGGPVSAEVVDRMGKASGGNALFLRELVLEAIGTGALREVGGQWQAAELPMGSRRLVELVADRIAGLDDAGRAILDLLALCQPVGLADLEEIASGSLLEGLEEGGLIQVVQVELRQQVSLAHPLYAEALRAALPKLRSRRILREHAARIEAHGARRRDDPLRIATWRLDADGTADPDLLERGALVARHAHDFRQTERLARAAFLASGSARAGLLLGEALYELGSFDQADQVLRDSDGPDLPEDLILLITSMRTKNLFWGHGEPAQALAVLRSATGRVGLAAAQELLAEEASLHVFDGDPCGALDLLGGLGDVADPRVRVLRAISEAPALTLTGRTGDAIRVAEQGYAEQLALPDPLAIAHPGTHVVSHVFALTDAGRFGEAVDLAVLGHEVATTERVPIARIWFALNLGRIHLMRGRPTTALRWYLDGVQVARDLHFDGPRRIGLSGLIAVHALLGDHGAARDLVAEQEGLKPFGFLTADQRLGPAWAAQAAGDPAGARARLLDAAEEAEATGHVVSASWLRHDAARLGAPGQALPLAALAERSDSELVSARAEHAAALAADDATRLAALVDRWVAVDGVVEAAEAAVAGADAHRRAGNQRGAAALDRRADELVLLTEGAQTPGLTRSSTVVPLSKREREVALLAARGTASKEISERLFLSTRTVNNHLQRAYTKLGVASRAELAAALGLA